MLDKSAAVNPLLEQQLRESLLLEPDMQEMQDVLNSDAAGSLAEDTEGDQMQAEVASDEVIEQGSQDPVDAFMEMEGKTPLVESQEDVEEETI